jgi:hypothetical protein
MSQIEQALDLIKTGGWMPTARLAQASDLEQLLDLF